MLAHLEGKIIAKLNQAIVLEVAQIGYRIFLTDKDKQELKVGDQVSFCLHHHIREEASDLYGFKTWEELELFNLLLSVSGIGPKTALGILSLATVADICEAVRRGDADLLTKVAGIGKKTAGRLVLELKNKLESLPITLTRDLSQTTIIGDELDALISLGYSLAEARQALGSIDPTISDSRDRLKAALRIIKR